MCFPQCKYVIVFHKMFCMTLGILCFGTMTNAYRVCFMGRKNGHIPGTRGISGSQWGIHPENAPITTSEPASWMNDHSYRHQSLTTPFSTALILNFISASEELYKKDLHDPGNHDGAITHLEPDIVECEVKWALESITTNKASGGDGIPVELFKILKDDAVKVLHSICQQIWKTQQ